MPVAACVGAGVAQRADTTAKRPINRRLSFVRMSHSYANTGSRERKIPIRYFLDNPVSTGIGMSLTFMRQKTARWTKEDDSLLGTADDRSIAGRLNRTLFAVRARRRVLGVPGPQAYLVRRWTPEEDALLGALRDEEV